MANDDVTTTKTTVTTTRTTHGPTEEQGFLTFDKLEKNKKWRLK